jgi:PhzF family phenazine biosynthesis protein
VYICSPEPQRLPCTVTTKEVSSALDVPEDLLGGGMGMINAGLRTLLVSLRGLDEVQGVRPDMGGLETFCRDHEVDIVLIFCEETSDPSCGYRTRVFAPKYGYLEDPATGSGNSALGHYLLDHGMWNGDMLKIEQGPSREVPNIVRLKASGPAEGRRVLFGGRAITRWERTLRIG